MSPSGAPAAYPFTLHANAAVAQALDVLRRTLDEETARGLQDPDAVRAAINRHFVVEANGHSTFASAIDLAGSTSVVDDPSASAFWLPMYEAVARQDSTYRRTVKRIDVTPRLARAAVRATRGPGRDGDSAVASSRAAGRRTRGRGRR